MAFIVKPSIHPLVNCSQINSTHCRKVCLDCSCNLSHWSNLLCHLLSKPSTHRYLETTIQGSFNPLLSRPTGSPLSSFLCSRFPDLKQLLELPPGICCFLTPSWEHGRWMLPVLYRDNLLSMGISLGIPRDHKPQQHSGIIGSGTCPVPLSLLQGHPFLGRAPICSVPLCCLPSPLCSTPWEALWGSLCFLLLSTRHYTRSICWFQEQHPSFQSHPIPRCRRKGFILLQWGTPEH